MELVNTNNENSFDPTPKLKSSPVPISFIPFNNEDKCRDWNRFPQNRINRKSNQNRLIENRTKKSNL